MVDSFQIRYSTFRRRHLHQRDVPCFPASASLSQTETCRLLLVTSLLAVITAMSQTAEAVAPTSGGNVAHLSDLTACDRSNPLGMISGDIRDWQVSASSSRQTADIPTSTAAAGGGRTTRSSASCHERHARLYQPDGRAWCARYKTASEWLQVDLGVVAKVTGLMTQGRGDGEEWVTAFLVSYSMDAFNWKYVGDSYGNKRIFDGNTDSFGVQAVYMNEPLFARFIKLHTFSWHGHPSLRVEIIGCQPCKMLITLPTSTKMSASSELGTMGRSTCRADDGLLMTGKAWCAKKNDASQWLQFDLGPPTLVTGVVTTGRGDTGRHHQAWVTRYRVAYSNDSVTWYYYSDASHLEPKEFGGNVDADIERWHFVNSPFVTRYVRLYPIEWSNHISLRAGLIGCRRTGKCPAEFTRITAYAPCVENLSYKKPIWINSYRPTNKKRRQAKNTGWRRVGTGNDVSRSSRRRDVTVRVDDVAGSLADRCVTLNNAHVDRPTIRIDLGRPSRVSGVVVTAVMTSSNVIQFPSKSAVNVTVGRRSMTSRSGPSDVTVYPVDRFDVYVDDEPVGSADGLTLTSHCGSSMSGSRSKTAGGATRSTARARTHVNIECSSQGDRQHVGRYVYVEAIGQTANRKQQQQQQQTTTRRRSSDRRSQLFSVIICDVTVY